MENIEFNVDQSLFKGKPTNGYYLFSANQKKDNNTIIAKYLNIDEESNITFHVEILPNSEKNVARILKDRYESYEYIVSVNSPQYYEDNILKKDIILCENEDLRKKFIFLAVWGLINCPTLVYAITNRSESPLICSVAALISAYMIFKGVQSVSQIKQLNEYIDELDEHIYDLIIKEAKRITRKRK